MSDHQPTRATHGSPKSPLILNDHKIQCYVLEDGRRVLSGRGMQDAFGMGQSHGGKLKDFMTAKAIKPFISEELAMELDKPKY